MVLLRTFATTVGRVYGFPAALLAQLESIDRHLAGTLWSSEAVKDELSDISRSVEPLARELATLRAALERSDAKLGDQVAISRSLEAELSHMREVVQPLQPATERIGRIAGRLPGRRRRRVAAEALPTAPKALAPGH